MNCMSFFFLRGPVKLLYWFHNMGFSKIITGFGFSNENKLACVEFEDHFCIIEGHVSSS